ncbi:MAG: NAD(P)-binding protein [Acidobacteria bacterium]|nr:NAD(P)-binding protein [Acidobacteriota bacterium]
MGIEYLIVGSGLTGAVIARVLTDAGCRVLVVEKRKHIGGNVHDQKHESGIRYHTYGPHFFRTSSREIWNFVRRFSHFYPFEAVVKTIVDGKLENWPIAAEYIERTIGPDWEPCFKGVATDFEQKALSIMPRLVYEKLVKPYTEKQWGVQADTLVPELALRFDVRMDNDPRLMRSSCQGLPSGGYTHFMESLLLGIDVRLQFDFLKHRNDIKAERLLVFTGPIDAFFNYRLGRLKYRSQKRALQFLADVDYSQSHAVINNPSGHSRRIRTIEWKNLMQPGEQRRCRGTLLTHETPFTASDPDQFEYPFPDRENLALYEKYRRLAEDCPGILICGRLGEYRYYDMDHAIARAMNLAELILQRRNQG